jgi:hypothetical protein
VGLPVELRPVFPAVIRVDALTIEVVVEEPLFVAQFRVRLRTPSVGIPQDGSRVFNTTLARFEGVEFDP